MIPPSEALLSEIAELPRAYPRPVEIEGDLFVESLVPAHVCDALLHASNGLPVALHFDRLPSTFHRATWVLTREWGDAGPLALREGSARGQVVWQGAERGLKGAIRKLAAPKH